MKKLIYILIGVALTVSVLAVAGYAYAQTKDPETPGDLAFPFDGMWGGRGGQGRGMWGGRVCLRLGGDGALSEYMLPALGEAFGLNDEQVKVLQDAKAIMKGIFVDRTPEEIQAGMQQAFDTALENAVADGAITQEQADQMAEGMRQLGPDRFGGQGGFGGRGMWDGRDGGKFGFGLMEEYLHRALAEAVGMTPEELTEAMQSGGFNLKDYAEEKGLTDEELADLMTEAYTQAINAALADEAITQSQADQMLESLKDFDGRIPFGPGLHGPRGFWFDQP
jgi:hypothetical protein